jgi:hypothetical protein
MIAGFFESTSPDCKVLSDHVARQEAEHNKQKQRLVFVRKLASGIIATKKPITRRGRLLLTDLAQKRAVTVNKKIQSINAMTKHFVSKMLKTKQYPNVRLNSDGAQNKTLTDEALVKRINHLKNSLKILRHSDGWCFKQFDQDYSNLILEPDVMLGDDLKNEIDTMKSNYRAHESALNKAIEGAVLEQERREALVYKQRIKGLLQTKRERSFDYKTLFGKKKELFWHKGRSKIDRLTKAIDDIDEATLTKDKLDNELNKDISRGVGRSAITRNRHAGGRFFASLKRNKHNPTGTYQKLKALGWKAKTFKK